MYKSLFVYLFIIIIVGSCKPEVANEDMIKYLEVPPSQLPSPFKYALTPSNKLIHKGVYAPDLSAYYYIVSDKEFQHFDAKVIHKNGNAFGTPTDAFFNSKYNEHGISFSPDGTALYFSSTRPVNTELTLANTWHLWRARKVNNKWTEPEFIDIPNLRDKLLSHPSITQDGKLYFHASKLNYSDMHLYCSSQIDGKFQDAKRLSIPMEGEKCTPYISPKGDYLIFANIGKTLDLYLTFQDTLGKWQIPKAFPGHINTHGQGNPWVSPDQKYLFYTQGREGEKWQVNWVRIASFLTHNPINK